MPTPPVPTLTRPRRRFQQVGDLLVERTDHVWYARVDCGRVVAWKCVLCGAVTSKVPPFYPTPDGWVPEGVEALTAEERGMCPFPGPGVV
jgi:hypothetical protein